MNITAGTKLGRYEIRSKIGEGGMGQVYLAQDEELERSVALKVLPAEVADNQQRMNRFVQEAKAASALNHPNILTIYEIGRAEAIRFIATEFIDGETLRLRMRKGPLKIGEVLDVAAQVASALSAAHAAGIIHRDIKPENAMRRHDGIVKVLDFGLAKLSEQPDNSNTVEAEAATKTLVQTEPGAVVGTVAYMSPEQVRGLPVDARTDIFSLGIVIYEMVTGRAPFGGATRSDLIVSLLERDPPPLVRFAPDVPEELERLVMKALAKDRDERYQTAKDLLIDLKRLRQKLEVNAEIDRTLPSELRSPSEAKTSGGQTPVSTAAASSAQTSTYESPRQSLGAASSVSGKQSRRGVALILVALLLAIAGIVYFFYFARAAGPIDSIAVMPLSNASNDPNTEYLSDGITESIISNLSHLPQLKVMARATVFRFKGKEVDPREVGQQLGVRAVMMGRLLHQGDHLIIRIELVNVADGTQLWGAEYDRKLSDVLAVQQEISREISEKLRLRLTGEDKKRLTGRDTTNAEAYQFYLRGRYFWNKRTAEGLKKATEQFQQALDRDSNYTLGHVGLADCYLVLELYAGVPSNESLPKARAAADRALQIDNSLAEAHTSSAYIYQQMWRWAEAEEEYKRAISLNPNYPTAHLWYGLYLRTKLQFDDALREIKRAQELDPLSPIISENVAHVYLLKNDFNSAIEQWKKIIELDPGFPEAHAGLAYAYAKQRRYQEAFAESQKAVELSDRASRYLSRLGYCYAVAGRRAEALAILKELEDQYARREATGQYLAAVYAGLGEKDQAFAWLERDFAQRSGQLPFITSRFGFEDFRSDPRYADLVRRMGLAP